MEYRVKVQLFNEANGNLIDSFVVVEEGVSSIVELAREVKKTIDRKFALEED